VDEPRVIAVLQRVCEARVVVGGEVVGEIGAGLLVLLCAEQGDGESQSDRMLAKVLKLRIFGDTAGKMNLSVQNMLAPGVNGGTEGNEGAVGGLLIVSQFTLAADASGGNRPSFTGAAKPEEGRRLYDYFVAQAKVLHGGIGGLVQTGQFGADMKVWLVNDGPVTVPLRILPG
jgi:D-aminoacyl-tRNA deacylase